MSKPPTPPSISATAFDCPHCGAFTTQYWYELHAGRIERQERVPIIPDANARERISNAIDLEAGHKIQLLQSVDRILTGLIFLELGATGKVFQISVSNLHLSECYNCRKIAVWVHRNMVFPGQRAGVAPNADLPQDILADFEEARTIVGSSPRGAAALLRLVVQKLCACLGEKGRSIDEDIASLVSKGLNPLVQQALDVVRVVGNEAVHPGTIDLKDDDGTALRLFELVNAIADQMITHPKTVKELYGRLPQVKLAAIDARNEKATADEKE